MVNYSIRMDSLCSRNKVFDHKAAGTSSCLSLRCLIKPHRLIDSPRILINTPAYVENVLPTLLCKPGCDLRAAGSVMTHNIDPGVLILGGLRERLRAFLSKPAHGCDLQPVIC